MRLWSHEVVPSLLAEQHVMGTLMHERLLSYNADVIYVWARAGNICVIH